MDFTEVMQSIAHLSQRAFIQEKNVNFEATGYFRSGEIEQVTCGIYLQWSIYHDAKYSIEQSLSVYRVFLFIKVFLLIKVNSF